MKRNEKWTANLNIWKLQLVLNKHLISHRNRRVFSSLKMLCWNIPGLLCNIIHLTVITSKIDNVALFVWWCWHFQPLNQNGHRFTGSLEFLVQWHRISPLKIAICVSHHIFPISCIPNMPYWQTLILYFRTVAPDFEKLISGNFPAWDLENILLCYAIGRVMLRFHLESLHDIGFVDIWHGPVIYCKWEKIGDVIIEWR